MANVGKNESVPTVVTTLVTPEGWPKSRSADPSLAATALRGLPNPYAQSTQLSPSSSGEYGVTGAFLGVAPGTVIGQYELIRELGRGGMGVVYLARDNKLGRRVAIKFMQMRHSELTHRFIKEAQVTARCVHENIVVIHEVNEFEGSPFMVLEYVEGEALSALRGDPQPMTRVVEIMVAVARALVCAHDEGIVHRDLKPENVRLGTNGAVKVLDFGIAKLLERVPAGPSGPVTVRPVSPDAHKTGVIGTMNYMSPEQWGAWPETDHRTDFWSVGLMLYELLSGVHPLAGRPHLASWVMQVDEPIPSVATVAPDLPADLVRVVDTCLSKDPDKRYANARDLVRELEPFLPGRYHADLSRTATGPYAGLRTFQEEDAGRFFGRTTECAEVQARLREVALLAVVGPSGVGKSSFVRAGIIPALKCGGGWEVFTLRPGHHPMQALSKLCARFANADPGNGEAQSERDLEPRLFEEPGLFGTLVRQYCRRVSKRVLIAVDQFEELYTLVPDPQARRALTSCLCSAADDVSSPVRVVATIRADFLGRVAEDAQFMNELRKGLFFLGPPSPEGLRQALVEPAEAVGYRFESQAMVEDMLRFLEASPSGLPLLQFAASQLWEARDPVSRRLTEASYRGMGGVAGALVTYADRVISMLSDEQQRKCRQLFSHLVTSERTRAVRTMRELEELLGDTTHTVELVNELVDSRLLVMHARSQDPAVEIVHESLIMSWPTLQRWLDANHEDSLFLDQLLAAANQWHSNREASGLLWGDDMVVELKRFQRRYQGKLPSVAQAFVSRIEQHALRGKRIKGSLAVLGLLVTVALLAAAAVALATISRQKARAEANEQRAWSLQYSAEQRLMQVEEANRRAENAIAKKTEAEQEVKTKNLQLTSQNERLGRALQLAQHLRMRAQASRTEAEENATRALMAKMEAENASAHARALKAEADERARRAEENLGPIDPKPLQR